MRLQLQEWPMEQGGSTGGARPGPASLRGALGEYGSLLADGWSYLFRSRPTAIAFDVVVVLEEDGIRLRGPGAAGSRLVPAGDAQGLHDVASAAARACGSAAPQVALAVADSLALSLRRPLPFAPTRAVEAIVATEARAYSPFPAERTRIAWAVTDHASGTQTVEALILDGELVDAVLRVLAGAGLHPCRVARLSGETLLWSTVPAWLPGTGAARGAGAAWLPAGAAPYALAGLAVLVSALLNLAYTSVMLQQLGPQATEALAATRQVAALEGDLSRVIQARTQATQRLVLLDAIAAALDDKTYLESYVLGRDEIELVVSSPSAAGVLRILSTLPGLRDAGLKSGVSRDSQQQERFTISAKVTEMPLAGDRP